jgi:DnaA family protein
MSESMSALNVQLPLAFRPGSDQRFIDFLGQDAVRVALENCAERNLAHNLFLAGASGSGKTHLLRAAVNHATALGQSAAYVPCERLAAQLPQILEGLDTQALVCIDDLQAIAGVHEAEVALFHFHNRAQAHACRLVYAGHAMPAQCGLQLPDLVSRLEQGLRLTVTVLDEAGKRTVLARRAEQRGLQLDEAVMDFLFSRVSRDLQSLGQVLDRLDHASLAAQRRLTIPFIKTVLKV